MARRVLFGPLKEPGHGFDNSAGLTQDLTPREIGILAPIALCCLFLGVYPKPVMNVMEPALDRAVLARVHPWTAGETIATGETGLPRVLDDRRDADVLHSINNKNDSKNKNNDRRDADAPLVFFQQGGVLSQPRGEP